ncbi:galactose mutarotase-like isoform X1 [Convolutriloba macropyga]|uniref:galactose mutarotase-like isoform X1 n=1 Tax=Convolutriloba macropyga TaxID=536237 RepID=UPI003F51CA93
MPVERRVFATLDDGTQVDQFTLTSEQLQVSLISFGASITNFIMLTKNNLDVCPSYPTIDGYLDNPFKMGASVGRVINRLRGGQFSIDGKTFDVDKNFNNTHCIHGGRKDFVHYNWNVEDERLTDNSVTLSHVSEDGDMGFPGKLTVFATFTLQCNELTVEYNATTDAPTPVNLTCHCYFNLAGHSAGKTALMEHTFQLNADHYLFVDDDFLPIKREPADGTVFDLRLHRDRVFYAREDLLTASITIPRKHLVSVGTCIGKFTKTGKFKLLITALPLIADYAQYKVWLKPSSEQSFLYGNHVTKAGLGRISENTPAYAGVVVYSMSDVPLGFGVAARSTAECRRAQPITNVLLHQSDVGEYIRSESDLLS